MKLTDEVRDVLAAATIDATSVRLTGQLDRDLYVQVDKVLRAAGGKWNRKSSVHVFDRDPRAVLGLAVATGKATNVKQALQAFYTPPELAARMVRLADIRPGHVVLEPSAGAGAIADAVAAAQPAARVRCVEVDLVAAERLRPRYPVDVGDFLGMTPASGVAAYDRIVMNPPFTKGQDIAHVTHALGFLKPGGRLVALTAPGWRTADHQAARSFRAVLDLLGAHVEDVPAGTFRASGTGVATVLVAIDRPSRASAALPVDEKEDRR